MVVSAGALLTIGIALARMVQRAWDLPDAAAYVEDARSIAKVFKKPATSAPSPIENSLTARVGLLVRSSGFPDDQEAVKQAADHVAEVMRKLADDDDLLLQASRDEAGFRAEIPKRFAGVRLDVPERGHKAYDLLLKAALQVYLELAPRSDGSTRAGVLALLDANDAVLGKLTGLQEGMDELLERREASRAAPVELTWPLTVGTPPDLAAAYQQRAQTIGKVLGGWEGDGGTVVVSQLVTGDGGHGKTQLARGIFEDSAADLRVWVDARTVDSISAGYADAAVLVRAPGSDDADLTARARAFLGWLANTTRSWLVVLDDLLLRPLEMAGWWPSSRGRVLVTTRRTDAAYASADRRVVPLNVYSPTEAASYLSQRLAVPGARSDVLSESEKLAADLQYLPVALGQASAVILDDADTCAGYRVRLADTKLRLADLFPASAVGADYHHTVAATWSIALAEAEKYSRHVGRAALLSSVLDPSGAPEGAWLTESGRAFLSPGTEAISTEEARAALRALHRFSVIVHSPDRPWQEVAMHAVAQRAVREDPRFAELVEAARHAAADALAEIWAEAQYAPPAQGPLRANSALLIEALGQRMCRNRLHPLLAWKSWSLRDTGSHQLAIDSDRQTAEWCVATLGEMHVGTIRARANLAASYRSAGRTPEAITLEEQVLTDRATILGDTHPGTLTARANLAASYRSAGRTPEAITLEEQVLTDSVTVLGDTHPGTLNARANLAASYWAAGRTPEAITLLEQVLADSEAVLGDTHPDTTAARRALVEWRKVGISKDESAEAIKHEPDNHDPTVSGNGGGVIE